jgi:hypothetical protein
METKRRVLLACGGGKRALTLETFGVIDDKYILVGITENDETIVLLHLTKRELLRNVIDLCSQSEYIPLSL